MSEPPSPELLKPNPPRPTSGLQMARENRRDEPAMRDARPGAESPRAAFDARSLRRSARRRQNSRRAFDGMSVLLLTLSAWVFGLILFAQFAPAPQLTVTGQSDGIVVLTGGSERIQSAVRLLNEKKADRLLISGVHPGNSVADVLRAANIESSRAECCIELDYEADDTRGNAASAAAWAKEHKLDTVTLVTASYHMRRAELEFDLQMPPSVALRSFPVQPSREGLPDWWVWPASLQVIVLEYNKYLLSLGKYAVMKPIAMLNAPPAPAADKNGDGKPDVAAPSDGDADGAGDTPSAPPAP